MIDISKYIDIGNKEAWLDSIEDDTDISMIPSDVFNKSKIINDNITFDNLIEDDCSFPMENPSMLTSMVANMDLSEEIFLDDIVENNLDISIDDISFNIEERNKALNKLSSLLSLKPPKRQTKHLDVERAESKRKQTKEMNQFAKEIIAEGNFMVIQREVFYYNGVYWQLIDKEGFTTIIKDLFDESITILLRTNDYSELFNQIKTDADIQVEKNIDDDCNYINFRNGVYDIMNVCMLPHSKNFMFFSYINRDFVRTYEGGRVFEEYMKHCSRHNEAVKQLLLQMYGYIASDLTKAKAFFILLGDRDSGKTTFGNLLVDLIGSENRAAVNFHELCDQWTPATLRGKKLVMDMDVSSEDISKKLIAMVNKLTGHDAVVGKIKYQNQFTFINTCKILIAANTLPKLHHSRHEDAFVKRMVVIPFGETVPDDQKDDKLLNKLNLEMDYILTQAMDALRELIRNNYQFYLPSKVNELKQSLLYDSIPSQEEVVNDYIKKNCMIDINYFTPTAVLYDAYLKYFKHMEYQFKPLNIYHFGSELSKILGDDSKQKVKQQRGFVGIRLINDV